jgi:hypothetical protein
MSGSGETRRTRIELARAFAYRAFQIPDPIGANRTRLPMLRERAALDADGAPLPITAIAESFRKRDARADLATDLYENRPAEDVSEHIEAIDAASGVIVFRKPMGHLDTPGAPPPSLTQRTLETPASPAITFAWRLAGNSEDDVYLYESGPISGGRSGRTLVIARPELVLREGDPAFGGTPFNRETLDQQAAAIAAAALATRARRRRETVTSPGALSAQPDGMLRSIHWEGGPGGLTTTISTEGDA